MKKYLKLLFLGISDEYSDEREVEIKHKYGFIAFNIMSYLTVVRMWFNIMTKNFDYFDLAFAVILLWYVYRLIKKNVLTPSRYTTKQKKKYILTFSLVGLVIGVVLAAINGPSAFIGGLIGGTLTLSSIYGGTLYYEYKMKKELEDEEE